MSKLRLVACLFPACLIVLTASVVRSQDFPVRPIRIVTGEPGGGNDFAARLLAQGLAQRWGQQVVVENRGAASGAIAGELLARAQPDGYTLLYYNSTIWLLPFLRSKVPYDPVRDFAPISLVIRDPFILFLHPSLPVKSVNELIALAKARPGEINFGSAGEGATTRLSAELFKIMAGVNIVRVPYRGTAAAVNGLIGGEVQMMFFPAFLGLPHARAGRLRALAGTGLRPSDLAPELPLVAATVPGYEVASLSGIFAPARTPAALIERLNQEIVRVLNTPEAKELFLKAGIETIGSTPGQFADTVKSEMAKWGKVIRDAGIREQ